MVVIALQRILPSSPCQKQRLGSSASHVVFYFTMISRIFPDVGSSFVLSRLARGQGVYLGLTGTRIHAHDLLHSRLATHYIRNTYLEELEAALGDLNLESKDKAIADKLIADTLKHYHDKSGSPDDSKSVLATFGPAIE